MPSPASARTFHSNMCSDIQGKALWHGHGPSKHGNIRTPNHLPFSRGSCVGPPPLLTALRCPHMITWVCVKTGGPDKVVVFVVVSPKTNLKMVPSNKHTPQIVSATRRSCLVQELVLLGNWWQRLADARQRDTATPAYPTGSLLALPKLPVDC